MFQTLTNKLKQSKTARFYNGNVIKKNRDKYQKYLNWFPVLVMK